MFWFVAVKWHSVTGGEDGLLNITRPAGRLRLRDVDLRSNEALFYFCLALFALARGRCSGGWCTRRSAACSRAIQQNEMRAAFVGYNVWLYKWLAFTIVVGGRRPGRRAVRDGAAVGLSRT